MSEPVEDDEDTLHRLEKAMAAIRQMPIPPPPTFSMPPGQVSTPTDLPHAFDHGERELSSSQIWGYVFVALATALVGLWFILPGSKIASDHAADQVAFDKKPAPVQTVDGLVSRSDIKEMDLKAVDLDRIDDEDLLRFSSAIAELKLDFQKPRRFSGYERLEKLLIAFTVEKRAPR